MLANEFELTELLDWGFSEKELDLDLAINPSESADDHEESLEEESIYRVPDAVWGTDNDLGIPLLDIKMQATCLEAPFVGWGTRSRKNVYRTYTDKLYKKNNILGVTPDESSRKGIVTGKQIGRASCRERV